MLHTIVKLLNHSIESLLGPIRLDEALDRKHVNLVDGKSWR